jgi:hypothetical protein
MTESTFEPKTNKINENEVTTTTVNFQQHNTQAVVHIQYHIK